jgi:hypothetical protein
MAKKIMVTYSIVTPESAAEGDSADNGFIDVPTGKYLSMSTQRAKAMKARGQSVRTVEEAAEFISTYGPASRPDVEPSSSSYHRGIWYTANYDSDSREWSEERSFHPEGFSLSEERQLFDLLVQWPGTGPYR